MVLYVHIYYYYLPFVLWRNSTCFLDSNILCNAERNSILRENAPVSVHNAALSIKNKIISITIVVVVIRGLGD